jgi:SAM-dependent methyltransferase
MTTPAGKPALELDASLFLPDCPICRGRKPYYAFTIAGARVVRCHECDFFYLNPQPTDEDLASVYNDKYGSSGGSESMQAHVSTLRKATAETYLDLVESRGSTGKRLLEIGSGEGYVLRAAERRGYDVTGIEFSSQYAQRARQGLERGRVIEGPFDSTTLAGETFDVCIVPHAIEHIRDPRAFLTEVSHRLAADGVLLITTPSRDSRSARLLKMRWLEFKLEHLSYFDRHSIESLVWQTGFRSIECLPGQKTLSLRFIAANFRRNPVPPWSSLLSLTKLLPEKIKNHPFIGADGGILVLAKKSMEVAPALRLSIVIPAFNEKNTIASVLDKVLAKQIPGLEKEIIVVESNSTDGTREIVQGYADRPDLRIILEEKPRGKGHATRNGLAAATGDIVLIQDADMEYDFEDYEALLEPIVAGREAFVLGARHGGRSWKMRTFTDQPVQALLLNLAHWGFTFVINVSLGIWLKDPFTMYKVFRRDCIHGLTFECNRFDFDWELLIKLVRKGYSPIEIPVNYRSRSFKEGKKIRMIRDPLTWAKAWAKARFLPL